MASFGSSPTNHFNFPDKNNSRRSSNNFTKFAFNIYGDNSNNSTSTTNSFNSATSHSGVPSTFFYPQEHKLVFNTNKEATCLASVHNYSNNSVIVGGNNVLKLLTIVDETNEIVEQIDFLSVKSMNGSTPGRKFNSVTAINCGYENYNEYVACGTNNGSLLIYNFENGKPRLISNLLDHTRIIHGVDFSSKTPYQVITGSHDGTIKLWDLRSKSIKASMNVGGVGPPVRDSKFSPHNSRQVVCVTDLGSISTFDLRNPHVSDTRSNAHNGPAVCVDYHPDLEYIVTCGRDQKIQVWNASPNSNDRFPEYVIHTSSFPGKVAWSPSSRNSRSAPSVYDNQIASCSLGDHTKIQIFDLKRKYIPRTVLTGHHSTVNGIVFRSPDLLWSVSKDKTFMQHDIKSSPQQLDNLQPASVSWGKGSGELIFVSENKSSFESVATYGGTNSHHSGIVTGQQIPDSTSMLASYSTSNGGSPTNMYSNLQQHSPNLERPSLMRSSTHNPVLQSISRDRPGLLRGTSNRSLINHYSPAVVPVTLPLMSNNDHAFEFLASNYMITPTDDIDIVSVCDFNATIAAAGGNFRDSQTWKVLSTSLAIEIESRGSIVVSEQFENSKQPIGATTYGESDAKSSASDIVISSSYASHSTQYGESPGSAFESLVSTSLVTASKDIRSNSFKKSVLKAPDSVESSEQKTERIDTPEQLDKNSILNLSENTFSNLSRQLQKIDVGDEKPPTRNGSSSNKATLSSEKKIKNSLDSDSAVSVLGSLPPSNPVPIVRKHRSSFLDSSPSSRSPFGFTNPDYDDENAVFLHSSYNSRQKSLNQSTRSSSPFNSVSRSGSMNGKPPRGFKLTENNNYTNVLSKIESSKSAGTQRSELSKAIADHKLSKKLNKASVVGDLNSDDTATQRDLTAPWKPASLIRQAAEYASQQGNIVMCATLSLLFYSRISNCIQKCQALDWLSGYCEILSKHCLFTVAADVIKHAPLRDIRGFAMNETTIRTYCPLCMELLVNEKSRSRTMEAMSNEKKNDTELDYGYWYCDTCCKVLEGCAYCTEPVKGMCVSLLSCGHRGHFGCMKEWFLSDENTECPAGCGTVSIRPM